MHGPKSKEFQESAVAEICLLAAAQQDSRGRCIVSFHTHTARTVHKAAKRHCEHLVQRRCCQGASPWLAWGHARKSLDGPEAIVLRTTCM